MSPAEQDQEEDLFLMLILLQPAYFVKTDLEHPPGAELGLALSIKPWEEESVNGKQR